MVRVLGNTWMPIGVGGNFMPGGTSGTSAEYYKCASVDTSAKTWSGYKAVFDSTAGTWSFEDTVTEGLTYTSVTPVVGRIYSADALVIVTSLWEGAPSYASIFDSICTTIQSNASVTTTTSATAFGSLSDDSFKWIGGVLAPNGKIYGIPHGSSSVLEIDPVTQTTTTFGSLGDGYKWIGGVLAPNGKIYGIPNSSSSVLEIDPVAQTATTFGSLSGTVKWAGGVLAPNGKIYGIPYSSSSVLEISIGSGFTNFSDNALQSGYLNKF